MPNRLWKAALVALCLLSGPAALTPALAQQPFVIVPDNPGNSGTGAGGNAVTTSSLNVRAGPGTRYQVIDVLPRGASVRIEVCQSGWCWINHRGPSGWVSQNHLDRIVGGGGGSPPVRPSREVCFYDAPRFQGRSFCAQPGDSDRSMGSWDNRIASVTVRGFPTVQLCADRNFNDCDAFNRDVPNLPWWLDRNVSSWRILH